MDFLSEFSNKKVLVTGGTGFTGSHLLQKLSNSGADVRCIARKSSTIPESLSAGVKWIRGDVYDADVVRDAMKDVEYVFHVAACFRDGGAEDEEYRRVHVVSTQLLARAAVKEPSFKRFVHTSTVGVHGHIANPPANEEAPFNPDDVYQRTKLEGELWIREFADQEGLPLAVVRPAAIIGPGDRRLLKLVKLARLGVCPLLDGHDTCYHLIHVDDLTRCMLQLASDPRAKGEVFICGNKESTTLRSMMEVIGDELGHKVRFISLPGKQLFIIVDAIEAGSKTLHVPPIIYRRRLAFFTKDRSFDTTKLSSVLGFVHQFDNESSLRHTVKWYKESGWI